MIEVMPKLDTPEWLKKVASEAGAYQEPLPLQNMLESSLYYPACGLNGTPVKYLGGNIVSFIYADYSMTLKRYKRNLLGIGPDDGFKGFMCIMEREVVTSEIVPAEWRPEMIPTSPSDLERDRLRFREKDARPFGHWSIWQKEDPSADGAEIFSLFYLGGEMNAVYQGLYNRLSIKPKILTIIAPGYMGGEWEGVESNNSFFKKVVIANPLGLPEYLLHGHGGLVDSRSYETPCWSEYEKGPLVQLDERYARLWRLG